MIFLEAPGKVNDCIRFLVIHFNMSTLKQEYEELDLNWKSMNYFYHELIGSEHIKIEEYLHVFVHKPYRKAPPLTAFFYQNFDFVNGNLESFIQQLIEDDSFYQFLSEYYSRPDITPELLKEHLALIRSDFNGMVRKLIITLRSIQKLVDRLHHSNSFITNRFQMQMRNPKTQILVMRECEFDNVVRSRSHYSLSILSPYLSHYQRIDDTVSVILGFDYIKSYETTCPQISKLEL